MTNSTTLLVNDLKQANQDFEFYPTTNEMINAVMRWLPEDARSIMDIGAGDGRVLVAFARKCKSATLYGIEKSMILIQAQPDCIVPVGTEFYEQNLSGLSVDYIFCNPPYSQFVEWVCKIISEGFAKQAFLVIPQRWKDSPEIKKAIKQRGALTTVIHSGDFLDAERHARAVVDVVKFSFPKDSSGRGVEDPFNIWFDQNIDTFEHAEEFKESETGRDLARKFSNSNIDEMVAAYRAEYELLEGNYRKIFTLDYEILRELGVDKTKVRDGLKMKMSGLKTKYWQVLFERLTAITSRLATKPKKKLIEKLTQNASVDFTASNAYSVVLWAIKNANKYFDEQLIDLFFDLSVFDGVLNYKSNVKVWVKDGWRHGNGDRRNTHYVLDYRFVVIQYNAIHKDQFSTWEYPGNLYRGCHELIADVVAVMSNLGFATHSDSSFNRQWAGGKWQDFYLANTDKVLFQVKAHMNGNLHFRFMPDAIKALNVNAGRLLNWLRTEEDVVTELGYSAKEAHEYFNRNSHILPGNIKLLSG